jgi:hypothetical protein
MKKKSVADFNASSATVRGLYEFLESVAGVPRFGERGASFKMGGDGKVLVRLEIRGGPGVLLDDDTLWVSMEVAKVDLPLDLCRRVDATLRPLSAHGDVHFHVPIASLSERALRDVRTVLAECFAQGA